MRRRLVNGLVLLSLALCLAALSLWLRSFWAADVLTWHRLAESEQRTSITTWDVWQTCGVMQVRFDGFSVSQPEGVRRVKLSATLTSCARQRPTGKGSSRTRSRSIATGASDARRSLPRRRWSAAAYTPSPGDSRTSAPRSTPTSSPSAGRTGSSSCRPRRCRSSPDTGGRAAGGAPAGARDAATTFARPRAGAPNVGSAPSLPRRVERGAEALPANSPCTISLPHPGGGAEDSREPAASVCRRSDPAAVRADRGPRRRIEAALQFAGPLALPRAGPGREAPRRSSPVGPAKRPATLASPRWFTSTATRACRRNRPSCATRSTNTSRTAPRSRGGGSASCCGAAA